MRLVFKYEVLDNCEVNGVAQELRSAITSFRYFRNDNEVVVLSNSELLFNKLRDLPDVICQKVDFSIFWKEWDFLPSGDMWGRNTFSKLFVPEIMSGEEFFYSDRDILYFNKIQPYSFSSELIQAYQGTADWKCTGFMHVPSNPSFSKDICKKVALDLKGGNYGDEYFFNFSNSISLIHPSVTIKFSSEALEGGYDRFTKAVNTRTGVRDCLGVHLVHNDMLRAPEYTKKFWLNTLNYIQENFVC